LGEHQQARTLDEDILAVRAERYRNDGIGLAVAQGAKRTVAGHIPQVSSSTDSARGS
jgi:hypothetical protein